MIDFLGIGAQKAGTTWLFRMLDRHPDVRFPAGKELHFWNRPDSDDAQAYLAHFSGVSDGVRLGEITPAYSMLDVEVIERIHALNPSLRLIFIIRNPMDRAWSSALMALGRAEMTINEASDQWFIDHFQSSGSLRRGDYETTLRNWRSVFPDEQLLLLRYEDIVHKPANVLQRCAWHLDVDGRHFVALPNTALTKREFAGRGYPLRHSLRPVLWALYESRIESLARYTGLDLLDWKLSRKQPPRRSPLAILR